VDPRNGLDTVEKKYCPAWKRTWAFLPIAVAIPKRNKANYYYYYYY
jgi:hypothetical protein